MKMNTGWQSRLGILKRDAESKILSKLRIHGWEASITAEIEQGDYIIIEASKGENSHKIALMYTSATANLFYKTLQSQVEHIFINGDLYRLDSFTQGITTPIIKAEDFHQVLSEWNKTSASGLFSLDTYKENDDKKSNDNNQYNRIQSENPLQSIWIHLRQLESVTLAKKTIIQRAISESIELDDGITTSKGEGLAFALRNASDYFRSAENRNINQRILNLYYGTLSLSFAEMLASPNGPSALTEIEDSTKQGHGLFTVDGNSDKLEDLVVGVTKNGFYSKYMEFLGHDTQFISEKKPRKYTDLKSADKSWITLEGILAKIPDIGDLFVNIFESKPEWIVPVYDSEANQFGSSNKTSKTYIQLIDRSNRWSKEDVPTLGAPFSEITKLSSESKFRVAVDHEIGSTWWSAITNHRSPYINQSIIVPAFNSVNQYRAICLAILYCLSIVVRYRPSLWRRVQEGDLDYMRVLIEAYLDAAERILPEQYLGEITGRSVIAKQPGSLF
jgi:hypothetical protein